jgi:hypothetical protein
VCREINVYTTILSPPVQGRLRITQNVEKVLSIPRWFSVGNGGGANSETTLRPSEETSVCQSERRRADFFKPLIGALSEDQLLVQFQGMSTANERE